MNAIDIQTKKLKRENRIGLMTHAVLGYPNMEKSRDIIRVLTKDSDFLELQIPFSDPIADGKTIMQASDVALKQGMNTERAFHFIKELDLDIPVIIMCYYNQIFRYGIEKFCQKAKESGVSALIVPDIPPEEEKREKFNETCLVYDLHPIRVMSPASGNGRLEINAKYAKGFVYCVSHFGVTGTKSELNNELEKYLGRVKEYFNIPIALGFGISSPEQIKNIRGLADIVIVGSAIINTYNRDGIEGVHSLVKNLKAGTILS